MRGKGIGRRLVALVVLVWSLGFIVFALALPRPLEAASTDGVVVLTGGEGRIPRGLDLLRDGQARRLLVSGVDREVTAEEFATQYEVEPRLMACCVTLGYDSVDTRSNAREAARWIAANDLRSVRLVTTDWHMRRAALDFSVAAPAGVRIERDAVRSDPSFKSLFLEYNKLLARRIAEWLGW